MISLRKYYEVLWFSFDLSLSLKLLKSNKLCQITKTFHFKLFYENLFVDQLKSRKRLEHIKVDSRTKLWMSGTILHELFRITKNRNSR